MANRGEPNYRRSSGGNLDETQVFQPVQNSGRYSQQEQYNSYSAPYSDNEDYDQDNSYYNNYDDVYGDYDPYSGYTDYEDYSQDDSPSRQTLASRASGRANPDPYSHQRKKNSAPRRNSRGASAQSQVYYDDYPAPRHRKKKRHPLRKLLISLLILAALIAGIYFMLFRAPAQSQDGIHTRKSGFYNILLCATDEEGTRTDTIILASLDQKNSSVSLTSIPRDTLVGNGESVPKINGVYGLAGGGDAGAQALMDQVESLLGFRPDGYVIISYEIFKDVVNAMGGVTFDVPMDMTVDDITLDAGEQELTGEQALALCRFRYGYAMADIQREYVQQTFIKAMVKQCLSASKLSKLPSVYQAAMSNLITDLDGANLRYLALHVLLAGSSDIQQNTLPGEGVDYYGASCYGLYGQNVLEMVNQIMNPYEEDLTLDEINPLTVSEGSLVKSTASGIAFDASTYKYN